MDQECERCVKVLGNFVSCTKVVSILSGGCGSCCAAATQSQCTVRDWFVILQSLSDANEIVSDQSSYRRTGLLRSSLLPGIAYSHHCSHAPHTSELELGCTNVRRIKHQNGNNVCNCAEFGDRPCRTNGTIITLIYLNSCHSLGPDMQRSRMRIQTSLVA